MDPTPKGSSRLSRRKILAYSVGHVLNDLCAACWFSYLLVFLHAVPRMSPIEAAVVMLSGQIADGVATPLVGLLSDRTKGFPKLGLGRRKTWIAGGAVLVLICFFLVFAVCLPRELIDQPSRQSLVAYYAVAASVFNVGWAAVQVAHMAMVPELTTDQNERVVLNSARYAWTIISNVTVFCVFLVLLSSIQPTAVTDQKKFTVLSTIVLLIGTGAVTFFLVGTEEAMTPTTSSRERTGSDAMNRGPVDPAYEAIDCPVEAGLSAEEIQGSRTGSISPMRWWQWFKKPTFYAVGVVYMCTRLVINLTQIYMPFFLQKTLRMPASAIAIIPLLIYIAGFISTFFQRRVNESLGRSGTFLMGAALCTISLGASYVIYENYSWLMYFVVLLLGVGNSTIMVASVCMEADLVGSSTESGAFVYGAMSFTDKLSNGLAVFVAQQGLEHLAEPEIAGPHYIRKVMCIWPAAAALVGVMQTFVLYRSMRFGPRHQRRSIMSLNTDSDENKPLLRSPH